MDLNQRVLRVLRGEVDSLLHAINFIHTTNYYYQRKKNCCLFLPFPKRVPRKFLSNEHDEKNTSLSTHRNPSCNFCRAWCKLREPHSLSHSRCFYCVIPPSSSTSFGCAEIRGENNSKVERETTDVPNCTV